MQYLKNNLPWIILVLISLTFLILNITNNKKIKTVSPSVKRLEEINDSLETQIKKDGVIIEFQKNYINKIKDTIIIYNNKTNTIIKNHNENIKDINYISNNNDLLKRINKSINTLDSIDKSSGFIIHRDTNRTSLFNSKSN